MSFDQPWKVYVVRMNMPVDDAAQLAELMPRLPNATADVVMDQFWLRSVLIEQRRRTQLAERDTFDERADRLLANLDPREA